MSLKYKLSQNIEYDRESHPKSDMNVDKDTQHCMHFKVRRK